MLTLTLLLRIRIGWLFFKITECSGIFKRYAVLFQPKEALTNMINSTVTLGETVIERFEIGKWDKHRVVITELRILRVNFGEDATQKKAGNATQNFSVT